VGIQVTFVTQSYYGHIKKRPSSRAFRGITVSWLLGIVVSWYHGVMVSRYRGITIPF
jgi:hypothetical protein